MTVKIAHIADTHLGYRQYGLNEREKDYYDAFDNIVNDIIERNVDYVIHSGDLFEQPKPPINALLCAQRGFLKLIENNIKIFVIAGNHDILHRKDTSIPQELYENENFNILSTRNTYCKVTDDIVIAGIQFIHKSHEEAVKEILNEILEDVKDYKHKILMLHGGTAKHFEFNPEFELDTIPAGFDYYAMGHIHKRIIEKDFKGGILSYPGSTEITDKKEIKDYDDDGKGYNLLSIDEDIDVEYINIPLERQFLIRNIKYPELDTRLAEIEKYIKNEILIKTDKKPVLLITVKEGNFERSNIVQRVNEKLGDISLSIRLKYEPTEGPEDHTGHDNELNPDKLIKEKLSKKYGEDIGVMGVELYHALAKQNLIDAQEICENYYNKRYNNFTGDKNDN